MEGPTDGSLYAPGVPRDERWGPLELEGATVWITGLPAAGKSTLGSALVSHLVERGRPAYLLDGDNLRSGINADLGFSAADRQENIRRTAHMACLFAEAGTVAVVAVISPYAADRAVARDLHGDRGLRFVEVWVDTPLVECERRDPKGLYAKARAGELAHFTGVDDPYEPPEHPDVALSPEIATEQAVQQVVRLLERPIASPAASGR
ncbi:MAG: bifunctional enzyme CysN/CysC [Solirubrobacteraceae bacterium]|nr:bifunctional enzyme CysN/CysC [Solirubrobacteraceae bacterium]